MCIVHRPIKLSLTKLEFKDELLRNSRWQQQSSYPGPSFHHFILRKTWEPLAGLSASTLAGLQLSFWSSQLLDWLKKNNKLIMPLFFSESSDIFSITLALFQALEKVHSHIRALELAVLSAFSFTWLPPYHHLRISSKLYLQH